ncbi:MAG: GNAT family N-acetyltransferase [Bacilli bacterium]|nr:GNAT family N-acetyltransferase [Bacilli bacterium]MDD4076466.1 GNAT family N-acetyltransferase [Bacilli bacterium]MDD4388261.1 GNAT family N-acetyltransferase [Bacilli bacterium]
MNKYNPFIAGNIEIRLTRNQEELKETMHLRYQELLLSYNENNKNNEKLFQDQYDEQADHLVAVDLSSNKIIGTYRLIRKAQLKVGQTFSSEDEFDISKIKDENILEISRAVVKKEYRTGAIIILLWKGLMNYAYKNKIKYIFGTASFYGTNPLSYSHALSYIFYNHLSPEQLRAKAKNECSYPINILPLDQVNINLAKKQLPALVKGYINIGATFGEDAYIDRYFNSIDLLVLAETEKINSKYINRFVK